MVSENKDELKEQLQQVPQKIRELKTKFGKQLVATKCLYLFFHNFKEEYAIDFKQKIKKFGEHWDTCIRNRYGLLPSENNLWWIYSSLDYAGQAEIMQKAFELYEEKVLKQFDKNGDA